jgi:hypothetical protein
MSRSKAKAHDIVYGYAKEPEPYLPNVVYVRCVASWFFGRVIIDTGWKLYSLGIDPALHVVVDAQTPHDDWDHTSRLLGEIMRDFVHASRSRIRWYQRPFADLSVSLRFKEERFTDPVRTSLCGPEEQTVVTRTNYVREMN